jgi:hypothetical protein
VKLPEADFKTMRLRYAGRCTGCAEEISSGERAHYLRGSKTVRCLSCGIGTGSEPTNAAGASAAQEAARAAERADRLAARAAAADQRAIAFAAGAEGERLVAEALAPLSAAGYILLHDRAAGPRSNLDHIVIGPSGVWLLNAKHWSGSVTVEGTLRQDGRSRASMLRRAREERAQVERLLGEADSRAPVHSMFAFTASAPEPTSVEGVEVVPVGSVRSVIGAAPPVLDGRAVDRAAAALLAALPPAGEAEYTSPSTFEQLPGDLQQDDAYFFLEPWSRYGKRRLYLHRFGIELGFVDLVAGTCHVTSDHERAQPNLEFIREWFSDVDAEPRRTGRLMRLAAWAAGAQRRAVAVRFRKQGIDRLYVHLADGRTRTQIGYFDLLTGRTHAAEPEFAAIVAKAAAVRAANGSSR